MLHTIEQNALGHFKYLPVKGKFHVTEDNYLTIIHCALGSSMFNIVYGSFLNISDSKIQEIIDEFQGQPFAWWIPSSLKSEALTDKLLKRGFIIEAKEDAMLCDLKALHQTKKLEKLTIEQVKTEDQREDFIGVLQVYDPTARKFYETFSLSLLQEQEKLFVGYDEKNPACIAILFMSKDTAGIFSLITNANKRGQGFGTQMMYYLMHTASKLGARSITLSATSNSGYRIYESLGFKSFGQFECFEWKGSFRV